MSTDQGSSRSIEPTPGDEMLTPSSSDIEFLHEANRRAIDTLKEESQQALSTINRTQSGGVNSLQGSQSKRIPEKDEPAKRERNVLVLTVFLFAMTAFLITVANQASAESGIGLLLLLFAGLTAMSGFSTFRVYLDLQLPAEDALASDTAGDSAWFDEQLPDRVDAIVEAELAHARQNTPRIDSGIDSVRRLSPWDVTAPQLIGRDNALALARLRMDLEAALRRRAQGSGVNLRDIPDGIDSLVRELNRRELLDKDVADALQEVTAVCNRAVHGQDISDEQAEAVVRAGYQLIDLLEAVGDSAEETSFWAEAAVKLLGRDNALALARLQMDLEAALRRGAQESGVNLRDIPDGIGSLARELNRRELLDKDVTDALQEIEVVCNRAVHGHGQDISDEQAEAVVLAGIQCMVAIEAISRIAEMNRGEGSAPLHYIP